MADLFAAARARAAATPTPTVTVTVDSGLAPYSRLTAADPTHGAALAITPMPHQHVVINAVAAGHRRLLVADEMGVGKTLSAIGALEAAHAFPALVIVPPSLVINWEREIARALPDRTVATVTGTKVTSIPTADVVIVPDSVIAPWTLPAKKGDPEGPLATFPWAGLVVDEAHRMKGLADKHPAKRARAAALISQRMAPDAVRLALSGTPILNRPREIIGMLEIAGVLHRIAPTKNKFLWRYCGPENSGWGWTYNGATNTEELHRLLNEKCMIRRLKADVLTLPDKARVTTPVGLTSDALRAYKRAVDDLQSFLRGRNGNDEYTLADRAHAIVLLTTLRQIVGEGKVAAAVEQAEALLARGEQVVIFGHHTRVIARISAALAHHGVVEIVGGMSMKDRQVSVDRFQAGTAKVLVGNMIAAGVGITLTSAANTITVELPWCPGILQQAEDRCHRIGQTRLVTSNILLAEVAGGSVDERMYALLDSKASTIGAILDDDDAGLMDDNVIDALLNSYR